jgi:hypothetical protein
MSKMKELAIMLDEAGVNLQEGRAFSFDNYDIDLFKRALPYLEHRMSENPDPQLVEVVREIKLYIGEIL